MAPAFAEPVQPGHLVERSPVTKGAKPARSGQSADCEPTPQEEGSALLAASSSLRTDRTEACSQTEPFGSTLPHRTPTTDWRGTRVPQSRSELLKETKNKKTFLDLPLVNFVLSNSNGAPRLKHLSEISTHMTSISKPGYGDAQASSRRGP